MKKRNKAIVITLSLLAVGIMIFVEQHLKPGYALKSIAKVLVFAGAEFLYSVMSRTPLMEVIGLRKIRKGRILFLGAAVVYAVVLIVFFIVRGQIDINGIRESLIAKEHLTRENCLFVFTYIILVNSFLEESFFRGFIYNALKDSSKPAAAIYSAVIFALYHLGIVSGWFNPAILLLCIILLTISGLFLQSVCLHFNSLAASWFLHGFANLAINTIGVILIFEL